MWEFLTILVGFLEKVLEKLEPIIYMIAILIIRNWIVKQIQIERMQNGKSNEHDR